MDKGSRLINLFAILDKLQLQRTLQLGSRMSPDDLQQLRYATSKIHYYVSAQDKSHRDVVLRSNHYIEVLLAVIDQSTDSIASETAIQIVNELIGKAHTSKRASILVSRGTTQVLIQRIVSESREENPSDDLLILIHQALGKLASKDRKFAVKCRLSQSTPVTLSLCRTYAGHPKQLQPLLAVLKILSTNAVNASYFGKNGTVNFLFRVLNLSGRKNITIIKNALDTLTQLVKSKSNSARVIGQGGVATLLNMFIDWHRLDSKNKHVSLRKAILNVLKHVTNLKSGQKELMSADGIRILYSYCQDALESRELESLTVLASFIMRKCFPKNRLPLNNLQNPYVVHLPESDYLNLDLTENLQGDDYDSSVDNDDDLSSDDDGMENKSSEEKEESKGGISVRSLDDLQMYKEFFPELHEFDAFLDECLPAPFQDNSIVSNSTSQLNTRQVGLNGIYGTPVPLSAPPSRPNSQRSHVMSAKSREFLERCQEFTKSASHEQQLSDLRLYDVNSQYGTEESDSARSKCRGLVSSHSFSSSSASLTSSREKPGAHIISLDFECQPPAGVRKTGMTGKVLSSNPKPSSASRRFRDASLKSSSKITELSPSTNFNQNPILKSSKDVSDGSMDGIEQYNPTENSIRVDSYTEMAAKTISVGRFNKIAYPDICLFRTPMTREPLYEKHFGMQRGGSTLDQAKIFDDIDRFINPECIIDRVVYDLDAMVESAKPTHTGKFSHLINRDEDRVGNMDDTDDYLKFNAQFESGNLRKAIQIRRYEYDLILSPDINTNHHHQWFYFEIGNMEAGTKYRFNIVNCEKVNSQFNYGMKPLVFSVSEAMQGRANWTREGSEVCYYKNHFLRSSQTTGGVRGKSYYTATFSISFKHSKDICYLAYHYPYTFTRMQTDMQLWNHSYDSSKIYYKNQVLTQTLMGNDVPVLTITSHPVTYDTEGINALKNRPYIFLSSRVHPGESNSSWVMKGSIDFLLGESPVAQILRDTYIFKIVPMLNPDGVINGCHRCSVTSEDLNRRWMLPCPKLHPTIYHTKGLLQYLSANNKTPLVFCDYHGHSRRKNVFMYGCNPNLSWRTEDMEGSKLEETGFKTLPRILQQIAPAFSLSNCSFMVEKSKESTARIVVWRQFGVTRSYTMESTYCGCDQGPYKGNHISTRELEEMGRKFCEGLIRVRSRHQCPGSSTNLTRQRSSSVSPPDEHLLEENSSDSDLSESNGDEEDESFD